MKQRHLLYFIATLCLNTQLFAQEAQQAERIQKLRRNIIACKILINKAKATNDVVKLGHLRAIVTRLEAQAQNI